MIAEDFALVKEIFSIIHAGIIDDYDAFRLAVEVGDGYTDMELMVKRNEIEITNAKTDFNDAVLYGMVKRLNESAKQRGEYWISFVMTYDQGGQVKTKFKYGKS
jgi:hypothetical protein